MWINKNLVHQAGDQTKVILRCTVNQSSRCRSFIVFIYLWMCNCKIVCTWLGDYCRKLSVVYVFVYGCIHNHGITNLNVVDVFMYGFTFCDVPSGANPFPPPPLTKITWHVTLLFMCPPSSYIEERRFEAPGRCPDYRIKCESLRSLMFWRLCSLCTSRHAINPQNLW